MQTSLRHSTFEDLKNIPEAQIFSLGIHHVRASWTTLCMVRLQRDRKKEREKVLYNVSVALNIYSNHRMKQNIGYFNYFLYLSPCRNTYRFLPSRQMAIPSDQERLNDCTHKRNRWADTTKTAKWCVSCTCVGILETKYEKTARNINWTYNTWRIENLKKTT